MVPIFLKVSKWFPFLLKRLTFVLAVKSRLTPLEECHVSVPRFFEFFFEFFLIFFFIFDFFF